MKEGVTLTDALRNWATPQARDHRSSVTGEISNPNSRPLSEQIGLLGPTTPPAGTAGAKHPVLNPEFVEALMGFPIGWTAFDRSETP